jgi:DNA-binding response OmpR family regulator
MVKVLLVEDDIALREIYSARFVAENFEVATADDGEQALSVAIKEKPDIIILDIMMPKISGFDVLDILRATPETKNTKVIVMSALSQESDIQKGKELGADAYLVKSQTTLSDVIQKTNDVLAAPPREGKIPQK